MESRDVRRNHSLAEASCGKKESLNMVKRIITTLILIAILGGGGYYVVKGMRAGAEKDQKHYRIATIEKSTVRNTLTATGILKAWTTVDIKSRAGGRVDRIAVEDGS